jgi:ketosteroid isomerase-like protein
VAAGFVREFIFPFFAHEWRRFTTKAESALLQLKRRDKKKMTTNLEVAKEMYARFGAGDFEGMVALATDDTEWHVCTGAPYGGQYNGKAQVLTWVGETRQIAMTRFEPTRFFADGDEVVVFISCEGTVQSTAKSIAIEMVHHMRFVDGRVSYLYEFNHDARLVAAAFEP